MLLVRAAGNSALNRLVYCNGRSMLVQLIVIALDLSSITVHFHQHRACLKMGLDIVKLTEQEQPPGSTLNVESVYMKTHPKKHTNIQQQFQE